MKLKGDFLWLGAIIGLLGPSIGIFIFYLFNSEDGSITDFIVMALKGKILSPLLSLCCIVNLAVFYLFIQFDKFQISRGIILSTFVYGLIIVILKFYY